MSIQSILKAARSSSLVVFLCVGLLGTATNLGIFYLLVDLGGWGATRSSIIAFCLSATQNYILNHLVGFLDKDSKRMTFRAFGQYFFVNLAGLVVNLLVMNLLILVVDIRPRVIAQFFGIGSGTALNYLGARYWVFRGKKKGGQDER